MQNDEDFGSLPVQNRILDRFTSLFDDDGQLDKLRYRYLNGLVELAREKKIDFKQLMFVAQMLPYLSNMGLDALERNIEDLISSLKHQIGKQDCTWQMVLKGFDFQPQAKKIHALVNESHLNEELRHEILDLVNKNECEFDVDTVRAFLDL
jgi:hypothetical protein